MPLDRIQMQYLSDEESNFEVNSESDGTPVSVHESVVFGNKLQFDKGFHFWSPMSKLTSDKFVGPELLRLSKSKESVSDPSEASPWSSSNEVPILYNTSAWDFAVTRTNDGYFLKNVKDISSPRILVALKQLQKAKSARV